MGNWDLTFHDVVNYFIPGSLLLTAIYLPIQETFTITNTNENISLFLFLVLAYALGHVLDPAFKLLSNLSRNKDKGRILTFLLGPAVPDWRAFYIDESQDKGGIPGLVKASELADAVRQVLGGSSTGQNISEHNDVFYTCWRLLEANASAGLRYHYRTMAFYNFAATMSLAFIIATPFLCWYTYQVSSTPNNCCSLISIALAAAISLLCLLFSILFYREYIKFRQEWIQNVYRLFWVWYKTQHLKQGDEQPVG